MSEPSKPLLLVHRERICRDGRRHSELFRVDGRRDEGKVGARARKIVAAVGRLRQKSERISKQRQNRSEFFGKARTFIEDEARV